jgi:hypothetical protein
MRLAKYGVAQSFYTILLTAGFRTAQVNPTLAAGDVTYSLDGGSFTNLATLPDVLPAAGVQVRIQLAIAELTAKVVTIRFADQTSPAAWDEQYIQINTFGNASAFMPFDLGTSTVAITDASITDATFATATYPKALRTATAQAGAAGTITLDASASATDNLYVGCSIKITSGTGAGQSRTILLYTGSSKIAYVDRIWSINPSSDSVFVINTGKLTAEIVNTGVAQAGAALTITLASTASASNSYYNASQLTIISGTGLGQTRDIYSYVGSTRIATIKTDWVTNPDSTSVYIIHAMGNVDANVEYLKGDSTSSTNLKNQFDGSTGLLGVTFPSRQDQMANLVSTGAATNVPAESWTNLSSPVATTETGGYVVTAPRDNIYDVLTNTSQAADSYYQFDIGGRGIPTGVSIYGAVQNGTKTVIVSGYNWLTSAWVQVGTMTGANPMTLVQTSLSLYTSMVGTGANLGKVRIRFLASASSTTITIDQIFVAYATVNSSIGYTDAAIFVDTNNGTAGTTLYTNGVADNPCLLWSDALILAVALKVKRFRFIAGSTITLSANSDHYDLGGEGNFTIALGGQSFDGGYCKGAYVRGTCTTAIVEPIFDNCNFNGNSTLPPGEYRNCGFLPFNFTFIAGTYIMNDCYFESASITTYPVMICVANTKIAFRDWGGAIQINGMTSTSTVVISGSGRLNIDSSCVGGNLINRGFFESALGLAAFQAAGGTVVQGARFSTDNTISANITQINASTISATALAASAGTIKMCSVRTAHFSPTITQFETDSITDADASYYVGRAVIFTSGVLSAQARLITSYTYGSPYGKFTVQALTQVPSNSDTFLIV